MTIKDIVDPFMLKPTMTSDGRKWVQRCYICGKSVNFIHGDLYVRVDILVRHKRCMPPPYKVGI